MLSLILTVAVGGAVGAAIGYWGRCTSGACALTANWRRGAFFGAILGLIMHQAVGGGGSAALNQSTANVKRISEAQFEQEVAQAALPMVVDFYAPWCGPCKALAPVVEELAGQFTNQVKFVKINVDEASALAERFNIQGVPTLLFFQNGKVVSGIEGLASAAELKAQLQSLAAAHAAQLKSPTTQN
jgi:thioredoxin 1